MSYLADEPASESPYFDLHNGHFHSLARVRQIKATIQDGSENELLPLTIVNLVSCIEWFARSMMKGLIDFAPDLINENAKSLRDVKLNYSTILRTHKNQFSIGDLIALSRNFSSFDEIQEILFDLVGAPKGSLFAKLEAQLRKAKLRSKSMTTTLNRMFRARHELVHGSPRHMMFKDERAVFISRRELLVYCACIEIFMRQFEKFMRKAIRSYSDRSTHDMRLTQSQRLQTTDARIAELERAIILKFDRETVREFRRAQAAWKAWRWREAEFQTHMWRDGTFRNVARLGEATAMGSQRIRQLEFFLRANNDPL